MDSWEEMRHADSRLILTDWIFGELVLVNKLESILPIDDICSLPTSNRHSLSHRSFSGMNTNLAARFLAEIWPHKHCWSRSLRRRARRLGNDTRSWYPHHRLIFPLCLIHDGGVGVPLLLVTGFDSVALYWSRKAFYWKREISVLIVSGKKRIEFQA